MQHFQASLEYPGWLQTQGVCKAWVMLKITRLEKSEGKGQGAREEHEKVLQTH